MKDKLMELAERWKDEYAGIAGAEIWARHRAKCACASELLAILDAEGDGGAVGEALNVIEHWGQRGNTLDGDDVDRFRALADKIAPTAARSGVVSDEDVRDALRAAYYYDTTERIVIDEAAMRAALEHFAKGEHHER